MTLLQKTSNQKFNFKIKNLKDDVQTIKNNQYYLFIGDVAKQVFKKTNDFFVKVFFIKITELKKMPTLFLKTIFDSL